MKMVELILGSGAFGAARVQSWLQQQGWGPSVWVGVWWAPGAADPSKAGVYTSFWNKELSIAALGQ